MITIEEARLKQKKGQKRCLAVLFLIFLTLSAVSVLFYFALEQGFYISLFASLIALFYIAYKVKITEFFYAKEFNGEVYHYEVLTKQAKKRKIFRKYDHTIFVANLYVKDKNGKIIKRTFKHTKEYDNVRGREKAVVLRFVDEPIIEFQNEGSHMFGKGKGERATDWKFDFLSLPYWNNRERIPYVYDKFHHITQSDTLCCIYSIAEVRMGCYVGFLAILKNKGSPQLILNISENMCFSDNFSTDSRGNIIFLQANIYDRQTNKGSSPIFIIDVANKKLSYYKTDNYNPCFKVVELSDNIFGIEADKTQKSDERLMALSKQKIDLRLLEWFDFEDVEKISQKVLSEL